MYTFIKVHKNTQNPLRILPNTSTYCTAKQVFYRRKKEFLTNLHTFFGTFARNLHIFAFSCIILLNLALKTPKHHQKLPKWLHYSASFCIIDKIARKIEKLKNSKKIENQIEKLCRIALKKRAKWPKNRKQKAQKNRLCAKLVELGFLPLIVFFRPHRRHQDLIADRGNPSQLRNYV